MKAFFILPILCVMLALPVRADDDLPDTLPRSWVVLEAFEKGAFSGFGRGGVDGFGPRIHRWEGPLRIAYFGDQVATWTAMLSSFVDALSVVDNLDIDYLGGFSAPGFLYALDGPQPNLTFIVGDAPFLEQAMEIALVPDTARQVFRQSQSACFPYGLRTNTPDRAFVFVRNDTNASNRATCLGYWLVFAAGMSVERQDLPSYFIEGGGTVRLTPTGRGAFELLYDPAMRAGTPMEQARQLARQLVLEQGFAAP